MQGERFTPEFEPQDSDLRNFKFRDTFGYDGGVHAAIALASIMNAFPRAVARNGVPLPIKCDVFKAEPGHLAYATRRDKCYWILFSEDFIDSCATTAEIVARSVISFEPSVFGGAKDKDLVGIVKEMTMEMVVQHELCHVKQGHVDYATRFGARGVAESTTKRSLSDRVFGEVRQRPMEFIADEAGIAGATLGSGLGNWILVNPSAKEHFDTSTLLLAAYLGMLVFTVEVSDIDGGIGYPSRAARTFHFHDMFCQYVRHGVTNPALQIRVNPEDLIEKAHVCLDVINEAADRGLLKLQGEAADRGKLRAVNFKASVASFFSEQARAKAIRECNDIAQECREEFPKWAPFHGEYISWQDYVAYERQNGRNPIGVSG